MERLPVPPLSLLQSTGVGKAVNAFKKKHPKSKLGTRAAEVLKKWKVDK